MQTISPETRRRLALGLVIPPPNRNRRTSWSRRFFRAFMRVLYTI